MPTRISGLPLMERRLLLPRNYGGETLLKYASSHVSKIARTVETVQHGELLANLICVYFALHYGHKKYEICTT